MNRQKKNPANILARKCISRALIDLLQEKPFTAITISELTERAGVSRMTYYRNYRSMEDIFIAYLDDAITDYARDIQALPITGNFYDIPNLVHYFSYVKKHRFFLDTLLRCGYGHLFLNTIDSYVMNKWKKPQDTLEQIYKLHAFSGALYNAYLHWSAAGARESADAMARALHLVFTHTEK